MVPDTVSPQMQKQIAAPLTPTWNVIPTTSEGWKEQVNAGRTSIDHDLASVRMDRERVGGEEKRVQDWARTLNEREKAIKENEDGRPTFNARRKAEQSQLLEEVGGKLRAMAQISVHVPSSKGEYGPVEDVHMILDHLVAGYLMHLAAKEQD